MRHNFATVKPALHTMAVLAVAWGQHSIWLFGPLAAFILVVKFAVTDLFEITSKMILLLCYTFYNENI